VRSVEIAFNRMDGGCLPVEIHIRMHRTRRSRGEFQRASGFGITVWDAAPMAFAEADRMKSIGWEVEGLTTD